MTVYGAIPERFAHIHPRGLLPLLGGIGMAVAFIISARDMLDPEYGFTAFGPIGGVFVIGVGMLALGVPLTIACAVRFRAFFRGETLMRTPRSWCLTRARSQWPCTNRFTRHLGG